MESAQDHRLGLVERLIAMLDVMEDHTDFALGMISKMANELLDVVGVADADPPAVHEHMN